MKRANQSTLRLSCAALFAIFLAVPPLAHAGIFGSSTTTIAQGTATVVEISGIPGENFEIAYIDENGVAHTKTVTLDMPLPSSAMGSVSTVPAASGTAITITNLSQPEQAPQNHVAARFTPDSETAVTALTMDAGSTLNAFDKVFTLGGGFTTIATRADYDPASPDYGTLAGVVPSSSFDIFATSGDDNIALSLDGGLSFSLNVASTWDAIVPDGGFIVPFTQTLAGSLTFLDATLPFTGTLTGTVTFFPDNVETIAGNIFLDGIGTGAFSASGRTMMVPVPEPPILVLMGIGLVVLMLISGRKGDRNGDGGN